MAVDAAEGGEGVTTPAPHCTRCDMIPCQCITHGGQKVPRFDWIEANTGRVWAMARGNPNCNWMKPGAQIAVYHHDEKAGAPSFYEPRKLGTVVFVRWSESIDPFGHEHVAVIDMLDQPPIIGPLPTVDAKRDGEGLHGVGAWLVPSLAAAIVLLALVASCALVMAGCRTVEVVSTPPKIIEPIIHVQPVLPQPKPVNSQPSADPAAWIVPVALLAFAALLLILGRETVTVKTTTWTRLKPQESKESKP